MVGPDPARGQALWTMLRFSPSTAAGHVRFVGRSARDAHNGTDDTVAWHSELASDVAKRQCRCPLPEPFVIAPRKRSASGIRERYRSMVWMSPDRSVPRLTTLDRRGHSGIGLPSTREAADERLDLNIIAAGAMNGVMICWSLR